MASLKRWWLALAVTLALIAGLTALAPLEKTLGSNVRLIYLHGAWVETGKAAFALAGLAGLAALLAPHWLGRDWAAVSLAFSRTALFFWLTYLPLSLYIQQANWGGIYWDEPRWKVPLAFGVAAVLLQAALTLFDQARLTGLVNLLFGVALWLGLAKVQNVLHPDSPVFASGSLRIEAFFVILLALCLACMAQIAFLLRHLLYPASHRA